MNPLTNVKNINKLNELEAEYGVSSSASWHQQYKDSAYLFIGGLPYELTEGDVICVFSQYGEVVNINLVRDKKTGKSKGYCFIAYEDQRSTILAVDNLNGIRLKGRTLRVDHVAEYRKPKDDDDIDEATKKLREEGCAPRTPPSQSEEEEEELILPIKTEKEGEKKKKKKVKKEKKSHKGRDHDSEGSDHVPAVKTKKEKTDADSRMDGRGEYRRTDEKVRGDDRDEKKSRSVWREDQKKDGEPKDSYRGGGRAHSSSKMDIERKERDKERRDHRQRSSSRERDWRGDSGKEERDDRRGRRDRERDEWGREKDRGREERRDRDRDGRDGRRDREGDRDRRKDRSDDHGRKDFRDRSKDRDRDRFR